MRLLFGLFFSILLSGAFAAPRFFTPDASYPLIRRDKLPLDVASITTLADQLALLADGPNSRSGKDLHNRARMLALSQRLSPAQPQARSILKSLSSGENRPHPDKRIVKEASNGIQRTAEWLVKLPNDDEGFLLGQLLLDIISAKDQKHPLLAKHVADAETSRWDGLIAPLEKFENRPDKPEKRNMKSEGPEVQFKTESVLTSTPIITKAAGKTESPLGIIQKVSLIITDGGGSDSVKKVRFRPRPNYDARSTLNAVSQYFSRDGRRLPDRKSYTIDTSNSIYIAENGTNIAAPVASLFDAALSGRPLRRNTYLFAKLENDGTLTRPDKAWSIFLELAEHAAPEGSRLIVPPDTVDDLKALLVLEKAEFFVQYEVLGASNFDEARPLFYQDGKTDPKLGAAMTSYQEVWEKAVQTTSIQTFVSHQSVKERLADIVANSNRHLSASLLALQGTARPPYFSEKMLAREILRCLEPLSDLRYDRRTTKRNDLRDLHDLVYENLTAHERRVANDNQEMYDQTLELIKKLKAIARNLNENYNDLVAINIFKGEVTAFQNRLKIASGDLVPPKPKSE